MDEWIIKTARTSLDRIKAHAELVELSNTNESVFRSFFMEVLREEYVTARLEAEWYKYDLLVQMNDWNYLIEFKYYMLRRTIELDGSHGKWKGGAGEKNKREFWSCVDKLNKCTYQPIHAKYLLLVYARQEMEIQKRIFDKSYEIITENDSVISTVTIDRDPLICKVLKIR